MASYSYIGKGSIYIGTANALLPVGNCSALAFAAEEEKKEMKDYENAGGGVLDTVSRISKVTLKMTVHNLSPENIARALRGASTSHTAATVTDEAHADVKVGAFVPFDRLPDSTQAVTVKKASTTLTENTDYTRVRGGIIVKSGGALSDGDDITVTYSALADNVVQALVSSGDEFRLFFDGLNEARSGKPIISDVFRVKFNPTKALDLISDDFAQLEIEADVLKDETKSGAGISQYFLIRAAQV